jgi:carboxymethylenebutenolidase
VYDGIMAETIRFEGHGGDEIPGYLARPLGDGPYPGVVVIHHMPGYDGGTKEITRTFASRGYLAVCPNLYWREAPGASADDAAAISRAQGGVPDERLLGDVEGAMRFLKAEAASNGKVGTIGYCSGGRQSFLAACSLSLDAAVDCYGAFVVGALPEALKLNIGPILHLAKDLNCPLLGLFGADDQFPTTDEVAELERELTEHAKTFEFHTYEGAGHAFFSTLRPSYRSEAADAGWKAILDFFGRYLSA